MLETRILTTPPYQEDPRPISVPISGEEMTRVVRTIVDHLEESRRYWGTHHTDIQSDRDLYKTKQPRANKPHDDACELVVPMLTYTQQNLVARTKRALFGPTPQFNLDGRNDLAKRMAGLTEDTIQRNIGTEYMDLSAKLVPALDGSFQDGTNIVLLRWRQEQRQRTVFAMVQRPLVDPYTGQPMMNPMGQPVLTPPAVEPVPEQYPFYDNLDIVPFDKENVDLWPPQSKNIQECLGVGFTMYKSGNELLTEAMQNNFDINAVIHLRDTYAGDNYAPSSEHKRRDMTGSSDTVKEFSSRPYKITECYWLYTPDPSQPAQLYLLDIHEPTYTVLRFRPNPWWHGEIPAVEMSPLPGKYGILGRSLPNLLGDNQVMTTSIVRLLLDDLMWMVNPAHATKHGMFSKVELELFKRKRAPGSIWEVNGDPHNLVPLTREGGSPQVGLAFIEMLRQFGARASSLDDINLGKAAPKISTAYEIENMLQEGEVMFAEMTDNLARSYLRLGRLIKMSMAQMAWHPTVQRVWGEAVAPDPTGLWCLQALWADYDMSAAGSAAAANAALRKKQIAELYTVLMSNPLTAQWLPRVHYLTSLILNEYDQVRYPERLIGTEQDAAMQQVMMMQAQAAQAQLDAQGQPGPSKPGGASAPAKKAS
ncbi:MAG: portal protein [Armatimonadota bacterium]